MGILTWIIFGLIAGGIAKLLMPGDDPGGCIVTMILGIVGAFVGRLDRLDAGVGNGERVQHQGHGLGRGRSNPGIVDLSSDSWKEDVVMIPNLFRSLTELSCREPGCGMLILCL